MYVYICNLYVNIYVYINDSYKKQNNKKHMEQCAPTTIYYVVGKKLKF